MFSSLMINSRFLNTFLYIAVYYSLERMDVRKLNMMSVVCSSSSSSSISKFSSKMAKNRFKKIITPIMISDTKKKMALYPLCLANKNIVSSQFSPVSTVKITMNPLKKLSKLALLVAL